MAYWPSGVRRCGDTADDVGGGMHLQIDCLAPSLWLARGWTVRAAEQHAAVMAMMLNSCIEIQQVSGMDLHGSR
jgi:hypothetical protein